MPLQSICLTDFRNYQSLSIEIPRQGMLLSGSNGSGKTNLLEAIHMLCIGRSQRNAQRSSMIRQNAGACHLEGVFTQEKPILQSLSVGIGFDRAKQVSLTHNGERISSHREWFGARQVVSFGPDDLALVRGEPGVRRRLLDILICQTDSFYLESLSRYQHALQNRNRLLARREDGSLLDIYEEIMAETGACLVQRRRATVAFCQEPFSLFYSDICGGTEASRIDFSASIPLENAGEKEWKNVFFNTLKSRRKADENAGFSCVGPHRDEVLISLDGRPARHYASQGQCRTIALALRLASAARLESQSNTALLFLVDDAFAELDERRMAKVYTHLARRGQVYMTTPLSTLPIPVDIPQYTVGGGTVKAR